MSDTSQGLEQAASAGDVPSSQEGQTMPEGTVSMAPGQEQEPSQTDDAAPKISNKDAKDWRKSDKEWQEAQEKAKKAEQVLEKLGKVFSDSTTPDEQEKDPATKALDRIQQLEQQVAMANWEADNPILKDERYADAWKAVNAEPRYAGLNLAEKQKLIMTPDTRNLTNELLSQAKLSSGSVPQSSRSAPSPDRIDDDTLKMSEAWGIPTDKMEHYLLKKKVA